MKDFLKFTFATVLGIIVAGVLFFFLSILTIFGAAASSESETKVSENSVFSLKLSGSISDRSVDNPLASITGGESSIGLNDILSSIQKAKENDNIKGIYLQSEGSLAANYASLKAIHDALVDFKESGKFIVAYADNYIQSEYYLASVADKVMLNPRGMLQWSGIASQNIFYKDLLEKLGVGIQVFKVGTYKSAVEPYISMEMSEANREQVTAYTGSIWQSITNDVAKNRNLSVEQLNQLADRMMMTEPAEANIECGLIDTLIYKNNVRDYLKTIASIDEDDDLNIIGLSAMKNVKKTQPKDPSGNIIAVYYAEGTIVDQAGSSALGGGETQIVGNEVIKDLRKLQEDDDVKAVVLRVNSPGGSAFASEQIWHAVTELKAKKPVIVSLGDYAASGGYYISCNADTIVAEPTTLTGSIGIFGLVPYVEKLTKKIGVAADVVKTNEFADFGDLTRPMNSAEQQKMQANVERGYDLFLTRCADGRGKTKEEIDQVGQGRVWTGSMAIDLGLVDILGGLDTALDIAIEKAGVEAYTIQNYPGEKSFIETLMESTSKGMDAYIRTRVMGKTLNEVSKHFYLIDELDKVDPVQARMPYIVNFN